MALAAARGELTPMPDCAIFADTGWEPPAIYAHLDWLETQVPFPVYRVSAGNIRDDLLKAASGSGSRYASIPFFLGDGGGMGRRQCTSEYKIKPLHKKAREVCGLAPGQRVKEPVCRMWIGISTDEAVRMKPSQNVWCQHAWPLIDRSLSRSDCIAWWNREYPNVALRKSSCIGCPYHSDEQWRLMRANDPASFEDACQVDEALRDMPGYEKQKFLHRSCKPLRDVDFAAYDDQIDLFGNECEGMCGV